MKMTEDQLDKALDLLAPALETTANLVREELFDRYMGEPYGDETSGRSAYMSTDVSDTVEAVFAEAMEIFTSDDYLIDFSPVGPDDEAKAREETAVVHHIFREQHNSFVTLATWFKAGLIEQNAYVRAGWVSKERVTIEEYEDLTLQELMTVYQQVAGNGADYEVELLTGIENAEALIAGAYEEPIQIINQETGEPEPIDVRVRCTKTAKEYEITAIPQNEFFISDRWNSISLEGCPVCGHRGRKSRGELVAMGFHMDSIDKLSQAVEDQEEASRHFTVDNGDFGDDDDDEDLELCEAYVRLQLKDDEPDRLIKLWTTSDGKEVLRWRNGKEAIEEVERVPFAPWTPYIVPHRHVGRSVAELAKSGMQLKTVLWRQTLDNAYKNNNPRPVINEDLASENTYKDLGNPEPGAPIRALDAANAIVWQKSPSILGETLPLMDRADSDLEKRAGVTRYAQGLGADTLSKTQIGSEGVGRIMDAGMSRMRMIIRTFAETGLRELFLLMHADMRRGPSRELAFKIQGEWIESNPLEWRQRTDMTVRIGTGKDDKELRVQALQWLYAEQKEMRAMGDPSVTPQHVYETLKRLVRSMGLQSIEPFVQDPATIPPPDPNAVPPVDPMVEAQMAMAQAEQSKAEAAMFKAQTDQGKAQAEMRLREMQLQLDAQTEQANSQERQHKMQMDMQFKAEEMRLDRDIAEFKAQEASVMLQIKRTELELKQMDMELKTAKTGHDMATDSDKIEADLVKGMIK
tara:strand:+ start:1464 stop:3704 length:2241 start_codon:yes stop_codon:yes gene_type:complete